MKAQVLEKHPPLEAYVKLHSLQKLVEGLMNAIREEALVALGTQEETVCGAKVTRQQKARTYDYGDDKQLAALQKLYTDAKDALTSWRKIRELQKTDLIDGTTGEVLPPPKCLSDGCTIRVELPL